ncbi:hypothetical protein MJO28_003453 [Puccinia striiformis f. sp. tritici]|uniref:Uncharacterized protein n=1 Tax=Puccinia striiformis f. sp. tritici TaxID=168172 RepID=A0ACC0EUZ8_9BASI|nr:hypothetical protein MJO28_003453 [Puccinia striiformis f. sp. tritici]
MEASFSRILRDTVYLFFGHSTGFKFNQRVNRNWRYLTSLVAPHSGRLLSAGGVSRQGSYQSTWTLDESA